MHNSAAVPNTQGTLATGWFLIVSEQVSLPLWQCLSFHPIVPPAGVLPPSQPVQEQAAAVVSAQQRSAARPRDLREAVPFAQ
mmetsp:Transcript_16114/g.41479  ORF Transcript_16114/g.41479 Transcript_16114/m.41479 type:complete len:82 (+) Transcript_16114:604-849(+)